MPTFRLENEQGQWLTDVRLSTHTWKPGDRISRGIDTLEVVQVRNRGEEEPVTLVVGPADRDAA
jgi:hypothetical protein